MACAKKLPWSPSITSCVSISRPHLLRISQNMQHPYMNLQRSWNRTALIIKDNKHSRQWRQEAFRDSEDCTYHCTSPGDLTWWGKWEKKRRSLCMRSSLKDEIDIEEGNKNIKYRLWITAVDQWIFIRWTTKRPWHRYDSRVSQCQWTPRLKSKQCSPTTKAY